MNKNTIKVGIENFVNFAKINIVDLAHKELSNTERKQKLDKAMAAYVLTLMSDLGVNFVYKWIIEKFIIKNIPVITQVIFDLLKSRLEGVTR